MFFEQTSFFTHVGSMRFNYMFVVKQECFFSQIQKKNKWLKKENTAHGAVFSITFI